MAELKTKPTHTNVADFLSEVADESQKKDCYSILEMMEKITGSKPRMWGGSIVGFGDYHYKYESGREGDWFLTGFSPRKQTLTLYVMSGFKEYDNLLNRLGKYKTGKSCLYINKLEQVDLHVLHELIEKSVKHWGI